MRGIEVQEAESRVIKIIEEIPQAHGKGDSKDYRCIDPR
jgi:hypothetical protein